MPRFESSLPSQANDSGRETCSCCCTTALPLAELAALSAASD
ncbi:MAG TPA: hypothetical protein VJL34_12240 [Anaerolineales bacterium]|nr:hypothetical protein [Anaerolineales bacterium]